MSRYGKMRASFDSESSLVPSPPLSPTRHGHPVYFVQSPSRESTTHDVDSFSQSFSRATPRESPMASPMHKHFKNGSSGSTSFNMATAPKPGSRRVLPHAGTGGGPAQKKGYNRAWAPGTILEEEGTETEKKKSLSRCCIFLIAIAFTIIVFFIGALVFWLVTMPHKPKITVQVIFHALSFLSICMSVSVSDSLALSRLFLSHAFCKPLISPSAFFLRIMFSLPLQELVCFEAAVVQDLRSDVSLLLTFCFFLHFFFSFFPVHQEHCEQVSASSLSLVSLQFYEPSFLHRFSYFPLCSSSHLGSGCVFSKLLLFMTCMFLSFSILCFLLQ